VKRQKHTNQYAIGEKLVTQRFNSLQRIRLPQGRTQNELIPISEVVGGSGETNRMSPRIGQNGLPRARTSFLGWSGVIERGRKTKAHADGVLPGLPTPGLWHGWPPAIQAALPRPSKLLSNAVRTGTSGPQV
jgi:hypothetical protein